MSRVRITGLGHAFGARPVLEGVRLDVADGEIMAVLGPSGCGKTTLLRIIAGFLEPTAGEVRFDDVVVARPGGCVPAWERRVGYVPQEGALFPHLDVRRNILFGLSRRERTEGRLAELLDLAELPAEIADALPRELSGGQQQRVALARALAPRPKVVLLDEPFSSLDAALRISAGREVIRVLRNAGSTALLVTHDQGEALSLADRVAVLADGQIAQVDRPVALYGDPVDVRVGSFVGDANLLPALLRGDAAESNLGRLPVRTRLELPAGTAVTLLLRPEQLRLVQAQGARVTAQVDEVVFYGAHASVRLALGDGSVLVARVGASAVPEPGEKVGVEVEGQAAVYP